MRRVNVPKIKFTQEEDDMLIAAIERMGTRDWEGIAQEMKHRTPRQCRERWNNYLSPTITSDPWSKEEDSLLDELFTEFGSKWSKISEYFPNRSANGIRNRYKLRQRRQLKERQKDLILKNKNLLNNALKHAPVEKLQIHPTNVIENRPVSTKIQVQQLPFPDEFFAIYGDAAELEERLYASFL